MAGTTSPSPSFLAGFLVRFDRVERAVHWANAALFTVLVATGASLYLEPIGRLVGRRALVEEIHVYAGLALPVPLILALAGRWGQGLRADLRRFNRWSRADRAWLRAATRPAAERRARRSKLAVGKFNAGQKLNAAFTAGTIVVMLVTGVIMRFGQSLVPLTWRTGATFVHDWLTFAAVIVITGHVLYALGDRQAMRAMWRGTISRAWAAHHAPAWLEELEEMDGSPVDVPGR